MPASSVTSLAAGHRGAVGSPSSVWGWLPHRAQAGAVLPLAMGLWGAPGPAAMALLSSTSGAARRGIFSMSHLAGSNWFLRVFALRVPDYALQLAGQGDVRPSPLCLPSGRFGTPTRGSAQALPAEVNHSPSPWQGKALAGRRYLHQQHGVGKKMQLSGFQVQIWGRIIPQHCPLECWKLLPPSPAASRPPHTQRCAASLIFLETGAPCGAKV